MLKCRLVMTSALYSQTYYGFIQLLCGSMPTLSFPRMVFQSPIDVGGEFFTKFTTALIHLTLQIFLCVANLCS